jgi:two-component system phosphate regulon sensor histidine kinase PhoR
MLSSFASIESSDGTGSDRRPIMATRAIWTAAVACLVGLYFAALPLHLHDPLRGLENVLPSLASIGLSEEAFGLYAVVLEILITLAFIVMGSIIFWQRPHEWLAAFVSLALIAVGVAFPPVINALEGASPLWLTLARVVRVLADTGGLILLIYVFPDGRFVPRWTRVMAVLWAIRNLAILLFPAAPFNPDTWPTLLWALEIVFWAGTGVAAQVYRYVRASTPLQRQQAKWLAFGLVMAMLAFLAIYSLPTTLAALTPPGLARGALAIAVPAIAAAFAIALPISTAIGFLRWWPWNIDVVTNRMLVYGTLIVSLASLYVLFVRVLTLIFQALAWEDEALVVFLATLGITLSVMPIRHLVRAMIDRAFYRVILDYQQLLPEISAEMAAKIVFSDLVEMLTEDLPRRLQIAGATVMTYAPASKTFVSLPSPDDPLSADHPFVRYLGQTNCPILRSSLDEKADAEVLAFMSAHAIDISIPLRRGTILMGAYNLGPKLSGVPYGHNDIRLLDMLVRQVAISLENAHLYEELRIHRDHLVDLVEKHTARIRNEQEKLATVLANVGDAIIIIGRDGLIEYVNNAWVRQSGRQPQDILGSDVSTLYAEPFPLEIIEALQDGVPKQEVWRGEAIHHRKGDDPFPVELAVSALRNEEGAVTHFVISQRDVSLQKEIEKFKADFISDVLHELRAPITNLKLYLDLLTTGPSDKRERYMATLQSESVRLERLVEDLVNLLKLEQGAIPLEIGPLDLNELAESVVTAYQEMAAEKTLTVEFVDTPGVPTVQADQRRIEQALTNLLVNAIAYTPTGGTITVWVGSARREDDDYAIIAVRDTGIGIDPSEQARIFDRFYRASAAKQSGAPGTGLGLAIVRQIMTMHRGDVTVQSQPRAGSTFTLWLPAPDSTMGREE